jgi:hypothetical protein
MADPVTISTAALGMAALTEGIKFLYGQAGELLKRWRERRDWGTQDTPNAEDIAASTEPANVVLPANVFEGQLVNPSIHLDALNASVEQLSGLRQDLTPYIDGFKNIESGDEHLLVRVDALRQLLEAIYQQRITFKGEPRLVSGPLVGVKIDVEKIAGDVAALRVKEMRSGVIKTEAHAKSVEPGGKFTGAEIERIG